MAPKFVAPITSLVFSAVCFLVLAFSAILLKRFSPVYNPVQCLNTNKTFTFSVNASGAYVTAFTVMECTNPNSFSVSIEETNPGRVYFHPDNLDIGTVDVEKYVLAEGGRGDMKADVALHIPPSAIAIMLSGEKYILEELNVEAVAHLNVMGFNFAFRFKQQNVCGFIMKVIPATMGYKTGPAICATSKSELLKMVPSIDSTPEPFGIGVSEERLRQATQIRNAVCGTVMCLSAVLGLIFLRWAMLSLCCQDGKVMEFFRSAQSRVTGSTLPEKASKPSQEEEEKETTATVGV